MLAPRRRRRCRAREVVFFGTDKGDEDVVFRQQTLKVQQQFARSITLENAMKPEPMLAWALNGKPLDRDHGAPLRLIMPGWYGVANVKWLSEIHLQENRFLGNFQARWYRTVRAVGGSGELTDADTQFVETEVTRMNLKSVIARVRKKGDSHQILGFVLNDGTPLKSVEVKIDEGPWQKATLDPSNTQFSWKLFSYKWDGATPGEHTIVSRATDAKGAMQPTVGGAVAQEDVPRRQLAVPAEDTHRMNGAGGGSGTERPEATGSQTGERGNGDERGRCRRPPPAAWAHERRKHKRHPAQRAACVFPSLACPVRPAKRATAAARHTPPASIPPVRPRSPVSPFVNPLPP